MEMAQVGYTYLDIIHFYFRQVSISNYREMELNRYWTNISGNNNLLSSGINIPRMSIIAIFKPFTGEIVKHIALFNS